MWLRGPNYDIEQELQDIQQRIMSQKKLMFSEIVHEYKNRSLYYSVILASVMFFQQFSGVFAILKIFSSKLMWPSIISCYWWCSDCYFSY